MSRIAHTLVLSCAGLFLFSTDASAQGSAGTVATPTVRQAPPAQPRGYTGFDIRFSFTMSGGQETASAPLVIDRVEPGSPAQKAGLAPSDIILEVDGRDAREDGALLVRPGVRYTYRIRRGNEEREVVLVAGTLPSDPVRQ